MKNFISMFLMTSLLLGGMTFTIGKMSVCAASKNRIETAQQKQSQLFGSAKNKLAATDPDFAQTMDNFIYGDVYSRGKLTDKQRELLAITALTASQTLDSLPAQVQAALKAGATPVEIKETLYQCAPYVGFPKTVSALEITNKVFKKQGIKMPLANQSTVTEATRFDDGFKVQGEIFGAEHIAAMHKNSPANQKHIANYLSEFCFGDTYTRNGLDLQMRELITLCAISTIGGAEPQVKAHVQANLNVGNDKELMLDAVTQCLPYIGFPRTLNHRLHQSDHPRQCLISIICKRIPVLTLKVSTGILFICKSLCRPLFTKRIYFAAYTFQPAADQSLHLPGPDILQSQSFCYIRLRAACGYSIQALFDTAFFTGTKRYEHFT